MFLINSRLSLFTATHLRGLPLSLSYGVNLPSSLTTLLPMALGFSPHLPVSVCGTDTTSIPHAFSRLITSDFATKFHSLTPGATNARYRLHSVSACLNCGGYGISTVCASATHLCLALASGLPGADEPAPGNLRFSAITILTQFSLLIPAFSLVYLPTAPYGTASSYIQRSPTPRINTQPKLRLYA